MITDNEFRVKRVTVTALIQTTALSLPET